jgi:DNA-binding Xre family transcriptional regulator
MSIRQLATLADVSPQTIQRLMKGEHINDANKIKIATILECDVSELISR